MPSNHMLSQILSYITPVLNPRYLIIGSFGPLGCSAFHHYGVEGLVLRELRGRFCGSGGQVPASMGLGFRASGPELGSVFFCLGL